MPRKLTAQVMDALVGEDDNLGCEQAISASFNRIPKAVIFVSRNAKMSCWYGRPLCVLASCAKYWTGFKALKLPDFGCDIGEQLLPGIDVGDGPN